MHALILLLLLFCFCLGVKRCVLNGSVTYVRNVSSFSILVHFWVARRTVATKAQTGRVSEIYSHLSCRQCHHACHVRLLSVWWEGARWCVNSRGSSGVVLCDVTVSLARGSSRLLLSVRARRQNTTTLLAGTLVCCFVPGVRCMSRSILSVPIAQRVM